MSGTMKALGELVAASLQSPAYESITVDELRKRMASAELTVVDCRAEADFARGHIPGAVNVPYRDFMKTFGRVPHGSPVVTVCYVGMYSRAAAQKLARSGHAQVATLIGGMKAWGRQAGDRAER